MYDTKYDTNDALFILHDGTDTGDGHSRLAEHLARNRWMFRDSSHKLTSDPTRFTAAAFQAGTPPIMIPPYISTHRRVVRAYPRRDTQNRHLIIAELAIPTPRKIVDQLPGDLRGWESDARGTYRPALEYDRVLAYIRLTLGGLRRTARQPGRHRGNPAVAARSPSHHGLHAIGGRMCPGVISHVPPRFVLPSTRKGQPSVQQLLESA